MNQKKRNTILLLSCLLLCFLIYTYFTYRNSADNKEAEDARAANNAQRNGHYITEINASALQIVKDMQVGWNLGNSLDSCDFNKKGIVSVLEYPSPEIYYETLWRNPVTTRRMIEKIADAGFGAVRIPVTWYDHMDENYKISEAWLDRVEEVVQYVLDNDMYCIINLHHEEAWLKADQETAFQCEKHLKTVWRQIAERFQGYDAKLLFEGFNEILNEKKNWTGAEASSYETVNRLNQAFVDAIRQGEGYNKERYLIVNTYGASPDPGALDNFRLPADVVDDHLIVQIHTYLPLEFTWTEKEVTWTAVRNNWDTAKDTHEIDLILGRLGRKFTSNGVPVIIGEFGAWDKNNTEERIKYARYVVSSAGQYGITCFWWDTGGDFKAREEAKASALLNRTDLSWYYWEIANALIEASK